MAVSSFLSFQQFQRLSQTEQQIQLEKRFQCLFDTQVQVNSVIKTCRNYEHMISPYNDIYLLNRTVRKYVQVYVDSNVSMNCPGVNRIFSLPKMDRLCIDTTKLLQQFLHKDKPDHALIGLMNITEELHTEQSRIIKKYQTKYDWKNLLPGIDLTLRPPKKKRRYNKT